MALTRGTCSSTTRSRRASLAACAMALAAAGFVWAACRLVLATAGFAGTRWRLLGTARSVVLVTVLTAVTAFTAFAPRVFATAVARIVISATLLIGIAELFLNARPGPSAALKK